MKPIKPKQNGFTLVEILVALAVLAMVMTAALTGLTSFATHLNRIKTRFIGSQVAHYQLTQLRISESWPELGRAETTISYASHEWDVVMETTQTQLPILRRVEVSVYGDDGDPIYKAAGFLAEPLVNTAVPTPW